jgi:hypothetical protein
MIDAETYGMIPSAKIVKPAQVAAGEEVHEAEQSPALRLGEPALERLPADAGRGDVPADPVDREQPERVEHPLAQVRMLKMFLMLSIMIGLSR